MAKTLITKIELQGSEKVNKKLKQVENVGTKSAKSMSSAFGKVFAIFAVGAAAAGFTKWMKESIKLANIQQKAVTKLNAAIVSTGKMATVSSEQLQKYASHLQRLTNIGDEVTISVMSTFAALTTLSEKGIQKATKATAGLSESLGIGLESAQKLVIKTINTGKNAFRAYGIQIDVAGTKADILDKINIASQSGFDQLIALAETYEGKVTALSNAYGDWREKIGGVMTENEPLKAFIEGVTKLFTDATDDMADSTAIMANAMSDIFIALAKTVQGLVNVINAADFAISKFKQVGQLASLGITTDDIEGIESFLTKLQGGQARLSVRNRLNITSKLKTGFGITDPFGAGKEDAIKALTQMSANLGGTLRAANDKADELASIVDEKMDKLIQINEDFNIIIANMVSRRGQTGTVGKGVGKKPIVPTSPSGKGGGAGVGIPSLFQFEQDEAPGKQINQRLLGAVSRGLDELEIRKANTRALEFLTEIMEGVGNNILGFLSDNKKRLKTQMVSARKASRGRQTGLGLDILGDLTSGGGISQGTVGGGISTFLQSGIGKGIFNMTTAGAGLFAPVIGSILAPLISGLFNKKRAEPATIQKVEIVNWDSLAAMLRITESAVLGSRASNIDNFYGKVATSEIF